MACSAVTRLIASSDAGMFTMSDADVTTPCSIDSAIPRLTLLARPRSSALMTSLTPR
jgi:hypothetical protein